MAHSIEHLYIFGEVFVKVFVPFLNCFVCVSSLSIPCIYFVFGWNDVGLCFQSLMSYCSINGSHSIAYNTYIFALKYSFMT